MRRLSAEEIGGKLQGFPDVYKEMFGEELNIEFLKEYLSKQLHNIKLKRIDEAFSNLHPTTLKDILERIGELRASDNREPKDLPVQDSSDKAQSPENVANNIPRGNKRGRRIHSKSPESTKS